MNAAGSRCKLAVILCVVLLTGSDSAAGQPAPLAEAPLVAAVAGAPQGAALPTAASPSAAAAVAAGTSSPAAAPAEPTKFSLIVVFRDAASLAALRAMCTPSPILFRLFHRGLGLPADCHMPGMCRRIYSSTIIGERVRLSVQLLRAPARSTCPFRQTSC